MLDLVKSIFEFIRHFWDSFISALSDVVLLVFREVALFVISILQAFPVPADLLNYQLPSVPSQIVGVLGELWVPQGFAIVLSAYGVRWFLRIISLFRVL